MKTILKRTIWLSGVVVLVTGLILQWPAFREQVEAAEATIDSTPNVAPTRHPSDGSNVVFTSDQVGYTFYEDSDSGCVYAKTTDGGTNWTAESAVADSQTDCYGITAWYDRWTPGDNTGNYIHLVDGDTGADDLWYIRLDTSNDSLSTPVAVSSTPGPSITSTLAGGQPGNKPVITKGTDGDLYVGIHDSAGETSFILKCATTCTSASNWSDTSATALNENTGDELMLMPIASGNIMAIRFDTSTNDMEYDIFTDSSGTWSGTFTDIDATAIDENIYEHGTGAAINRITGDLYLVYYADVGTAGTDDDVRTARYNGSTWDATTADVITDSCEGTPPCNNRGITGAKIAVNENNGDVYVVYSAQTTPGTASTANIYYKKSTDNMASWGGESTLSSGADDYYALKVVTTSTQRLYADYFNNNAAKLTIYGNTIADLTPPTYAQQVYRWLGNTNDTTGGSALAAENTVATLSATGDAFRLRMLLRVGGDGAQKNLNNLKLQFAAKSGTCDTGYSGESYADVTTGTVISYKDNATPTDGSNLTANGDDPTDSGITIRNQTYEELNNFTNSNLAIASGEDGKWDFALYDNGASASTSYCFRVVYSDASAIATPVVVPEIITAAGGGDSCTTATTADQMRHGNHFSSGVEQKFCWAN